MGKNLSYEELEQGVRDLGEAVLQGEQTREALREKGERYRRITEAVTDYVFSVRVEDGYPLETVHGPGCVAVTGYRSEDFASDPHLWIQMVHEEDRVAVQEQAKRVLLGQDVQPIEHRILRKDHVIRWVRNTLVPHYDRQGKLFFYDGLIRDITERKQAEEALISERDKFRSVLNAIGEGGYIVNSDFTIEYLNEFLIESFGHSEGEKCYSTFFQLSKPCEFCDLRKAIESAEVQDIEAILPDGKHGNLIFSPFTDADHNVKIIVLSRDITEKKTLVAEAMRAGHLASLGELAAGVAHEINNPVTGIIACTEILKSRCHDRGEDDEILTRIIKEAVRIAQIVKNLLSFAQDREEEHGPTYVRDVVLDTLNLAEKQIIKDGTKISVDFPSDLPMIKTRSREIQQVFLNILSNARYDLNKRFPGIHESKLIEIRGETIEIEGQEHVRTTFFDNGTGISADILDKIIEPFFSTIPQGEGTGLGLSISHGIIKGHRGRLQFESVEGEYTKVIVDIPVDSGL